VPVLDSRELLLRGRAEVLILTHGCRPTYLRQLRYYERGARAFRGLWDRHETPSEPSPTTGAMPVPAIPSGAPPWLTSPP
jgi:hypothetical protein